MWNDLQDVVLNEKQSVKHYKWYTIICMIKICTCMYMYVVVCICIREYTQTCIYRHINIYVYFSSLQHCYWVDRQEIGNSGCP